MQKNLFHGLGMCLMTLVLLNSCSEPSPSRRVKDCPTNQTSLNLTTTTYNTNVAPIFQAKCISCHSGQTNPNLSTYELVKANYTTSMNQINSNSMPRGSVAKLTAAEKSTLTNWAQGGFIQSETTPTTTPPVTPSTQVNYETNIKPLMTSYCFSCHASSSPILSDYNTVKANANQIYSAISSGSMPKNSSKMSSSNIVLFKSWIDAGLLEGTTNTSTTTTPTTNTTTPSNPQNSSGDSTGC